MLLSDRAAQFSPFAALSIVSSHPEVAVTYFRPDKHKEGGRYGTVTGTAKKIDAYEGMIVLTNGSEIPIAEVLEIERELLKALF